MLSARINGGGRVAGSLVSCRRDVESRSDIVSWKLIVIDLVFSLLSVKNKMIRKRRFQSKISEAVDSYG